MLINEIIRKTASGYRLYSKKGKNLGTYDSRAGAEKREKQVNYFKHMNEGYKLQLERADDMYILHITDSDTGKRTEVRGKSGYESGNYDADDKLHQLLDRIGKTANVSELINGEVVTINPKHPDAERAKKATDVAFNEETGAEMLKIFRNMHHDTARNKEMDTFIKAHEWELRDFTPDMFPSEEEFFDYDDPFDRVIDIDYHHRVDLSQPIIVGPQYSDGKYSVIDGNHRAARAQELGKTIKGYFPVKATSEGVAREPHAAGLAKTALTAPANTVVINTPGELDWYKLGEYIATLQNLDPHEYGQSESDMMVTLANREQVEKLKALLDRFGADYKEIGSTHQHPEVHTETKRRP
jgi:hypothetical protein